MSLVKPELESQRFGFHAERSAKLQNAAPRPSGPEIIKALRGARIRFDDRAHRQMRKRAREYRERKSRTLSASRKLSASL